MPNGLIANLILGLAIALAGGAALQEKEGVQIKVASRLILVDLIATDASGGFVADLKPEELQVFEEEKRREIAFFEKVQNSARRPAQSDSAEPRAVLNAAPGSGATATEATAGATVIFLIDLPSIAPGDLPQVKQAIAVFSRSKTGPNDSVMLATVGGGADAGQAPTRNKESFIRRLEGLHALEDASSRLPRFGADLEALLTGSPPDTPPQSITRRAIDLGRQYIAREEQSAHFAFQSALALIKEVGSLPGRKNVLFFSGGYRPMISAAVQDILLQSIKDVRLPGGDTLHLQIRSMLGSMTSMEKMNTYQNSVIEEANRSRVSFYTVDARALMTREDIRFPRSTSYAEQIMREETSQPQNFLRDLASGTGGRSFLNSNDLEAGIGAACQDAARYYELAFVPEGSMKPGALHKITLKALRPHVQISYRRSYAEPDNFDPERRAVENALKFTELFQDFPVEADVSHRDKKLKVGVFVPVRLLDFIRSGDRYRCDLAVHLALFDHAGNLYQGKTLFSKTYKIDFSELEYGGLDKIKNVTSSYEGAVSPGSYRLRIAVRQPLTSKTSALEKRITISE